MRLLRVLLFAIVVLIALASQAFAKAPTCAELFAAKSKTLKTPEAKSFTLERPVSQAGIDRVERELEAFLTEAKISFSKIPAKNADKLEGFTSHGYLLDRPGAEASKAARPSALSSLLIEAKSFDEFADNARVLVDTLYDEREASAAHYVASEQLITLSPRGLEGDLPNFRHEFEHHRQQVKINHGEFSLARFIYRKDGAPVDKTYDFYLSFDELDAYLISLKSFLKNDKPRAQGARAQLEMLITKERALLTRLKEHLDHLSESESHQLLFGGFNGKTVPMNGLYDFQLSATEKLAMKVSYKQTLPRRPAFNQIRFLVDQTIEEAEWRIEDIEKELAELK